MALQAALNVARRGAQALLSMSLALFAASDSRAEGYDAAARGVTSGAIPFAAGDERVGELWTRGRQLEVERSFVESARVYEEIVEILPEESHLYWRIARNHFGAGQVLPMADEKGRLEAFTLTEEWGGRGVDVDSECAECYLYRFIGLSSAARIRGIWNSARRASEMRELLGRAMELQPTWVDHEWNNELANLYFAAGVFYTVVPDSAVAKWTLGVRGDRFRARGYYRRAIEICPARIDYHMGLGALLLCAGNKENDDGLAAEGLELLRRISSLKNFLYTDQIDREHSQILLSEPSRACEYSRDKWRLREGR
jgi:tetratricopeptide (TPR) repeat protein